MDTMLRIKRTLWNTQAADHYRTPLYPEPQSISGSVVKGVTPTLGGCSGLRQYRPDHNDTFGSADQRTGVAHGVMETDGSHTDKDGRLED